MQSPNLRQTQQTEQTEQNEQTESLPDLSGHTLMIYCGAGMTEPFEEIAAAFGEQTGCEMNVTYANAGQIQTQITTAEEAICLLPALRMNSNR